MAAPRGGMLLPSPDGPRGPLGKRGAQVSETAATYSVEVADRIRDDIIKGQLAFGSRLTLAELAARYESGQMPVREALRQLQGEGLLDLIPNKGARVKAVDRDLVVNLFDIRVVIEAMLTRRAAERIVRTQIVALEEAALHFEQAAGSSLPEMLGANRRFHTIINEAAANSEASAILHRSQQLFTALWHRHGYGDRQVSASIVEHRNILTALRAGDADSAAAFAMAHASRAKLDMLASFRAS